MPNDIAFKVIIKNDGISDIIFKTLMLKGEAGGTISSIEKTATAGLIDTYTITLNDGTTTTFEVTNGSNIESIEKTATAGLIDTYTVTLTNGDTTTFEVKNGEDAQLYELPADAVVGYDKEPELNHLTGQHGYVAFDAYGIKNVKVTGYTKQETSPSPDYPQDIIGYGTKEQDGTYTIDIEVTDNDDNVYNITASGLAYPLYDGDVLDFENSKVIRKNGCVDMGSLNWIKDNSTPNTQFYVSQFMSNTAKFYGNIYCEIYKGGNYSYSAIPDNYITAGNSQAVVILRARDDSKNTYTAQQFTEAVQGIYLVYELASPTEESVTISGDTSIVENLRGWTQVDAWDVDVTLDAWYYSDVDFPDGYEEIDFPLDDMFYYQDGDEITFPVSWGFVNGYVFNANEIRLTMNLSKMMKDDIVARANRSIDLALDIYTGAGVGGLTGFNSIEADYIQELGQIQISLKTENPHGLTVGSLIGARVNRGVMTVFFERRAQS